MNILEKLGLAPKNSKDAPVIGEKKKQQEEASSFKRNLYLRSLIIISFLGLLFLSIPETSFKEPVNYSLGEPWRTDDLIAPFTFAIKKSDKEIQEEKEAIQNSTPPIFHANQGVNIEIESKLDSLFQHLQSVSVAYAEWQNAKRQQDQKSADDSTHFVKLTNSAPVTLSDKSWQTLVENYQAIQGQGNNNRGASQYATANLDKKLKTLFNDILTDGIINRSKSQLSNEEITVRNLKKRTEQTFNLANVRDLEEAKEYARYRLSKNYYKEIATAADEIFDQTIQPNFIYDSKDTQARINNALADISTSKGAVTEGQVIVRRGDKINKEKLNQLQSLAKARAKNASSLERWLRYGGEVLAIIAIVTIFFFYLYLYRRHIFTDNAMLLLVLLALSIICVASSFVYGFEDISPYIVPIAVAPIILTIIFDSRVGLLSTITLALLTGLINGNNFEFATATTVACSLGLFSVRDIKNRSQFFFITPGIVFLSYALVSIGFSMTTLSGWSALGNQLFYVFINAIFIFITYPLILIFEKTFNVTTDFTLIELADTNLPILKELMTKAPGTFHHSLQVSNLAEAAAGAIGANGLLCRVGGLYHDIGKMENPNYFTENQTDSNEHDKLKPRMSALVIKAHVSNGVKIAEEHNLPTAVINFIQTHHGTTLIKFFWHKAKEQADENKKEIREEDFRYDGPPPQTKETGILLLADCVEASSRAMKEPNYQKLENLIDKMINDRVNEEQLSRTPLTFEDLHTIKETFLNILVGIYHSRVEYPDDETDKDKKEGKSDKQGSEKKQEDTERKDQKTDAEESPTPVSEYYNS